MNKMTILAPAKINLYLNVTGKRPDGYHNIESVMQSVSLFDRLTITKYEADEGRSVRLIMEGISIAGDPEQNLICRAASAFFAAAEIDTYDILVYLEKNIPTEAGLGGGSADAAATIVALDRLYETGYSKKQLCEIGVKLGADVPFCIMGGTIKTEGIGEIMTPLSPMPPCHILLAKADGGKVSTAEAYRRIDAIGEGAEVAFSAHLDALASGALSAVAGTLYNKFELVTPAETGSAALVKAMLSLGALGARMSGSGAAVFGLFEAKEAAEDAMSRLPDDIFKTICEPFYGE